MSLPVLLIAGCRKYQAYLEAAIKRMSSDQWEIIGIIGNGSEVEWNPEKKILTVTASDVYEKLPSKLQEAYSWIYANRSETPGVFKTDEDILFDKKILAENINKHQQFPYWGLVVHQCANAQINQWRIQNRFENKSLTPSHQSAIYCFGGGYWLNRQALGIISEAKEEYANSCLEDVCTGFVLNQKNIIPFRVEIPAKEVARNKELLKLQ